MRSPEGDRSSPDLTVIDWEKRQSKKASSVWFKSITAKAACAGGTRPSREAPILLRQARGGSQPCRRRAVPLGAPRRSLLVVDRARAERAFDLGSEHAAQPEVEGDVELGKIDHLFIELAKALPADPGECREDR